MLDVTFWKTATVMQVACTVKQMMNSFAGWFQFWLFIDSYLIFILDARLVSWEMVMKNVKRNLKLAAMLSTTATDLPHVTMIPKLVAMTATVTLWEASLEMATIVHQKWLVLRTQQFVTRMQTAFPPEIIRVNAGKIDNGILFLAKLFVGANKCSWEMDMSANRHQNLRAILCW